MSFEQTQKIQKELNSTESLLWAGVPQQGIVFRPSDLLTIPFSLLWCGFAIYWEYSAVKSGATPFFLLFGGFFVLVGLYVVFGRFIVDMLIRKKTSYAVSNERIILMTEFPMRKVISIELSFLPQMTLSVSGGGTGSISFGPEGFGASYARGFYWPGMEHTKAPTFDLIPNVQQVFTTIRDAQDVRQHT